jgi:hypothetical protein
MRTSRNWTVTSGKTPHGICLLEIAMRYGQDKILKFLDSLPSKKGGSHS